MMKKILKQWPAILALIASAIAQPVAQNIQDGEPVLGAIMAPSYWKRINYSLSPVTSSDGVSLSAPFELSSTASISGTTTLRGVTYTWPSADGSSNQRLTTNGSGTLSWATVTGGGGGASSLQVKEGNTSITNPTASLSFSANGFQLIASDSTDIDIRLDYTNGPASRSMANIWTLLQTFSSGASFSNGAEFSTYASASLFTGSAFSGNPNCDDATDKLLWDDGLFTCGTLADADIPDNITITGLSGTNTGDVTLAGTPNYLTLSGQQITLTKLDISDDTNATGGTGVDITANDFTFDSTEVEAKTWGAGAGGTIVDTYNLSSGDPTMTWTPSGASLSLGLEVLYASASQWRIQDADTGAPMADCEGTSNKITWDATTFRFNCEADQNSGGGGGLTSLRVKEIFANGVNNYSAKVSSISFDAGAFILAQSASSSNETRVRIDYGNGPASRAAAQTITGLWTFSGGVSVSTTNVDIGTLGNSLKLGINAGNTNQTLEVGGTASISSTLAVGSNVTIGAGSDIRPSADSTSALNIANSSGTDFVTFDTTNSRIGIGNGVTIGSNKVSILSDVADSFRVVGPDESQNRAAFVAHGNQTYYNAVFRGDRGRNTAASPAVVQSGDYLFNVAGCGWNTSTYACSTSIGLLAEGTYSSTNMPGRIIFETTPANDQNFGNTVERMRIDSNGFISINTTTPNTRFEVSGAASISQELIIGGPLQVVGAASQAYSRFGSTTTSLPESNWITQANDVLISGDLYTVGSISANIASISGNFNANGRSFFPGASAGSAGDTDSCFDATNNELTDAGANTCIVSSERFKENIVPLENCLEKVLKLNAVGFNYKPELDSSKVKGTKHVGLIAEDMQKIEPRLVSYEPDGITPRGIDYESYTALLTCAMQEQQEQMNKLLTNLESQQSFFQRFFNWLRGLFR